MNQAWGFFVCFYFVLFCSFGLVFCLFVLVMLAGFSSRLSKFGMCSKRRAGVQRCGPVMPNLEKSVLLFCFCFSV